MSRVAHYLQEHLLGEVISSTDARRYFATDGSIFQLAPALVAYPKNENDVRKTARFSWQLAERGRVIPITARGSGTNQTGAALSSGILLIFPAHLNRILELDNKANTVTVEPGINYGKLQQVLYTHNRFLPPYPPSLDYSTIGGAIATNASGEKSFKYGDTADYVTALRVVLANGEVIETGKITKRQLNKKLGLATFEGEIYRSVDTLLEENHDLVEQLARHTERNSAGYNLLDVIHSDGSFDLTPLFVGSQGTLGIITEATLKTEAYNPQTTLLVAPFDSLERTGQAINALTAMSEKPSAIELVDGQMLSRVHAINPNHLNDIVKPPFAPITLLVEFNTVKERQHKRVTKKAQKILEQYGKSVQISTEPEQQQQLWKLRRATSNLIAHNEGPARHVPLIDGSVAPDRMREYLEGIYKLFQANDTHPGLWGHAGDGNLFFYPLLNLSQVGDRQKAFRLLDGYYKLINDLNGSISAGAGDGRLRTPYLEDMYGPELYALLGKIKKIFDPYGTLNPGVKFDTTIDDLKAMIRPDYNVGQLYDHLPRS